ncbi:MAG: hypothetical protein J6V56_04440 [Clostridia bacterium]|nr:hypothetical protein [Clostridia bacterium]
MAKNEPKSGGKVPKLSDVIKSTISNMEEIISATKDIVGRVEEISNLIPEDFDDKVKSIQSGLLKDTIFTPKSCLNGLPPFIKNTKTITVGLTAETLGKSTNTPLMSRDAPSNTALRMPLWTIRPGCAITVMTQTDC